MVVVGSYRKDLYERLTTSAVSVRVAAAATVPVVVVPDVEVAHRSGIVVGVDGGESSTGVLERALHEGIRMGEPVTVVTAWSLPPMTRPDFDDTSELSLVIEQRAHGVIREVLERVEAQSPGLLELAGGVTPSVVFDSPAGALLGHSREAALLVVGSHGRRGIGRFLLGSVSHDVLVHTTAPTLVLRVRR
ncbi:MAG: universal stress protein, partial [Herbiconiux sp.]|nr:universal stress protein [Herbiconiux sp.]